MSSAEIVRANGVELFVRRLGDPALPALLVIHGGPTWDHSYLWPAVARFADVAHVVAFDLRGCGRSSRVPPVGTLPVEELQPEHLAADAAALIEDFGSGGRADVLGFSYGGGIAMRLASAYPDRVRKLVLASTTAYRDVPEPAAGPVISWDDPELTGPDAPDGALSRAMAHASAPDDVWALDRLDEWHRVLADVRFSSDWNAPYAAGLLRPGVPDEAAGLLRDWSGPVLIVQGRHDRGFPVSLARRLHAELPGSVLAEIPRAAHMAHFDNPDAWRRAVRAFLTGPESGC